METMGGEFVVEIVETKSGEVVKSLGPMPGAKAERVEAGIEINLNHEHFHTRIVPAGAAK